jgi:hypothetical protein
LVNMALVDGGDIQRHVQADPLYMKRSGSRRFSFRQASYARTMFGPFTSG